ncbi:MAG: hypothetical protein WBB08_00255 [Halobacteriota archaeon]
MEYELAEEEKEKKKDLLWRVRLKKLNMDFTLSRYKELCLALLDSGYTPLTVYSYLVLEGKKNNNNKLVVLRHDIDRKFGNALLMAE